MFLHVLCGILSAAILLLLGKIIFLKKGMDDIRIALEECLSTDTNILISISSQDSQIRRLASELNTQLRQLRKQRRKYLSGNSELRQSITNISHDLRTPLTAICGYLDLLEHEEQTPDTERYLDIIRERVEALKQLTEEFFRYSVLLTPENGNMPKPVSVNRMLEESLAAFYTALTERGIVPCVSLPEKQIICTLDHAALSRIFSNLLSNAIRYSDGDLNVTLSEKGEIVFTNTASGLDEIQVGRLFDRFYTVETASKSTGLGLSIARSLAEQMGGTLSASYCDKCLSIRLSLPGTPEATAHTNGEQK